MPRYCGQCGTRSDGGNFCVNCGSPLTPPPAQPVAPGAVPPASAGPAGTSPAGAGPAGAGPAGAGEAPRGEWWSYAETERAPRPPIPNPFSGVPASDYVRDIAAVVLLFTSLGLPWDYSENTAGRWWALISVLLAVLAVVLPYVGRAALVPGWGGRQVRVFKVVAFVPLAVSVVAALVNELVHVGDPFEGGIGTGLAMALAGGLLAVQPRAADEDPAHRDDRAWNLAARVAAVAAVVLLVGTWLAFLIEDAVNDGVLFDDVLRLLLYFVELAAVLVLVGVPVVRFLGHSNAGRRVLATVGFTVLLLAVLSDAGDGDSVFSFWAIEKWNTPLAGSFALAAAAALAVSRPGERGARSRDPLRGWVSTASLALVVSALALALVTVRQLLAMIWVEEYGAAVIITCVLTLAGAVALFFARTLLTGLGRTRGTLLAVVAGVVLLGIITAAVGNDFGYPLDRVAASAWFTLPLLAMWALTVPGVTRSTFGPLMAERPAEAPAQAPAQGGPAQGGPAQGGPAQGGPGGHAAGGQAAGPASAAPGAWSTDETRSFDAPPAAREGSPPPAPWPPPPARGTGSSPARDEDEPPPGSFRP